MYVIKDIKKIGIITGISLGTVGIIAASTYFIKNYLRQSDCELPYSHLHVYEYNHGDIETVFHSERINLHGYTWTDRTESYGEDDLDRIDYMEKNSLVDVYRNLDYLTICMATNTDYDEYEYWYKEKEISGYDEDDEPIYTYSTKYDYTRDINHSNLTGKARTVHTKYYTYSINRDNNGKFCMNKSCEVDDITNPELIEMYPYFKVGSFSKKVYYDFKINTRTKVRK